MEKSANKWKIALACVLVAAIVAIVVLCVNSNGQINNLKDEKDTLVQQAEKDKGEITTLTEKVDELTGQVETLTGQVESSRKEIETLTAEKAEMTTKVEALQTDLSEKEETINSMKDFFMTLFEGTGLLDEEVAAEGTEAAPAAEAQTEAATEAAAETVAAEATTEAAAETVATEATTEAVAEEAATEAVAETVAEEVATEAVAEATTEAVAEAATEAVAETVATEAATEAVAETVAEEAVTAAVAEAVTEGTEAAPAAEAQTEAAAEAAPEATAEAAAEGTEAPAEEAQAEAATEAAPEATAEAAAEGTEEAEAPVRKYADEHPGVMAFHSLWVTDDGNAVVNLAVQDDRVEVVVLKKTGDHEHLSWEYLPEYDDEKKTLTASGNGMKSTNVMDAEGNITSSTYEYEDGSAVFSLDESGNLIWKDEKEDAGAGLVFHRIGWFTGLYMCDRASMEIRYVPAAKNYSVKIEWADSASENNEWTLTGTYHEDTNTLTEVTGTEKHAVYGEDGSVTSEETVAEITGGTISFDDDFNVICKGVAGIEEAMAFERQINSYWME